MESNHGDTLPPGWGDFPTASQPSPAARSHCDEQCAKNHGRDLGLISGLVHQLRALWKPVSPSGALCSLSPAFPFYSWEDGGCKPQPWLINKAGSCVPWLFSRKERDYPQDIAQPSAQTRRAGARWLSFAAHEGTVITPACYAQGNQSPEHEATRPESRARNLEKALPSWQAPRGHWVVNNLSSSKLRSGLCLQLQGDPRHVWWPCLCFGRGLATSERLAV